MRNKIIFLLIIVVSGGAWSAGFKKLRTNRISPLSDSYNSKEVYKIDSKALSAFRDFNLNNSSAKNWQVRFGPSGYPDVLSGDRTRGYRGTSSEVFSAFVRENSAMLGISLDQLRQEGENSFGGVRHINYRQYYRGLPVEFSSVRAHFNSKGEISLYQARYYRNIDLDIFPSFSSSFAESVVRADLGFFNMSSSSLVVYPDTDGSYKLAWKLAGRGGTGSKSGLWIYYVDAHSGRIIFSYDDLRYACTSPYNISTGTVKGYVYDISPIPTGNSDLLEQYWQPKILVNLDNHYVWVGSYSNRLITGVSNGAAAGTGEYCTNISSRVFSLLQGPYFAINRFMSPSSYFTNGSALWTTQGTAAASPNPYANDTTYTYNLSLSDNWSASSRSFAFAAPVFSSFRVGSMDACGGSIDSDHVEISSGSYRTAYYTGNKNNFIGGYTPYPSYSITLKTDSSGAYSGFSVAVSTYMTIANASANNATGSIVWATNTYLTDGNGGEVNSFYHLNKIRDYFDAMNKDPNSLNKPININTQIPVMTQVFADVTNDSCTDPDSMWNAFYDLENDYIFLGRGPMDTHSVYRDFALDGTIIRHEYIHLVVNRIYPIINFGEFGAISEAMADYFSLSSFWKDGKTINTLGNFIGSGEGAARDISLSTKRMPDDWIGEVHDDSLILSPALYKIRRDPSYMLGNVSAENTAFVGLPRADVYIFSALFYFPDNFTNLLEAILDSCRQLEPLNCDSAMQTKIKNAFSAHGIYPASSQSWSDKYEPNNGPEWATNLSTFSSLSAFIDYSGDVDYYSIPLNEGLFYANMTLPAGTPASMYHAYSLFLFDQNRKYLVESVPEIYSCPPFVGSKECLTLSQSNSLVYNVTAPGRYYLMVSAAPGDYGGNSADYDSARPYTLSYQGNLKGSGMARIYAPAFDADEIYFEVKYPKFNYIVNPASSAWTGGSEVVFQYARLLDHNRSPIALTETNYSSSYLSLVGGTLQESVDAQNNPIIKGRVKLKSGFAARYPAIGTVYLEIFATNHLWDVAKTSNVVSLGISNAINLTTDKSDFVAYNNIINSSNSKTFLKYDIKSSGSLSIKVYTPSGTLVKTIYNGSVDSGKGTFEWDGTNEKGNKVASGIYFVKTEGPGVNKIDRVAIIR
ncbi:MAG: hypothetical protein Fur0012_13530 [Elusimicrobiota bacterium]